MGANRQFHGVKRLEGIESVTDVALVTWGERYGGKNETQTSRCSLAGKRMSTYSSA